MAEREPEEVKVRDRRHFHADGTPRADMAEEEEKTISSASTAENRTQAAPEPWGGEAEPLAPTFLGFLSGLVASAASHLGLIPHPVSGQPSVDLTAAKSMIDILAMLEEKTKGNLTAEEVGYLRDSLTELRLIFVRVAAGKK